MNGKRAVAWVVVGIMVAFVLMAADTLAQAADTSLTVGPGRQILKVHHTVPVYVGNFNGEKFQVQTHFAYFDKHNYTFVRDDSLPLTVAPAKFTIRNGQQLTVNVTLNKKVPYPMVAVAFEFVPANMTGTGVDIHVMLYGELTTHPKAAIFTPPPAPNAPQRSNQWLLVLPFIWVALVLVWFFFGRNRKPKRALA